MAAVCVGRFVRYHSVTAKSNQCLHFGRTITQAVSSRPFTAEARVLARVIPYGICVAKSGTGTGFSPSSSAVPCQYHSTVALHACIT
jgi:hypothetical protein